MAMESTVRFEAVDSETADLLSLVRDEGHVSADHEWSLFLLGLVSAAKRGGGLIRPNDLRPMIRGKVAPRRIGAFTHRALSQGLVAYTGDWEVSDDRAGRNGGKPARVMRWLGEAS
jgi:hypothetical protein